MLKQVSNLEAKVFRASNHLVRLIARDASLANLFSHLIVPLTTAHWRKRLEILTSCFFILNRRVRQYSLAINGDETSPLQEARSAPQYGATTQVSTARFFSTLADGQRFHHNGALDTEKLLEFFSLTQKQAHALLFDTASSEESVAYLLMGLTDDAKLEELEKFIRRKCSNQENEKLYRFLGRYRDALAAETIDEEIQHELHDSPQLGNLLRWYVLFAFPEKGAVLMTPEVSKLLGILKGIKVNIWKSSQSNELVPYDWRATIFYTGDLPQTSPYVTQTQELNLLFSGTGEVIELILSLDKTPPFEPKAYERARFMLRDFFQGITSGLRYGVVPVYLGLLIYDLVNFKNDPSGRYGNTVPSLLFSLSQNQETLSAQLGTDNVYTGQYPGAWLYPFALMPGLPLMAGLLNAILNIPDTALFKRHTYGRPKEASFIEDSLGWLNPWNQSRRDIKRLLHIILDTHSATPAQRESAVEQLKFMVARRGITPVKALAAISDALYYFGAAQKSIWPQGESVMAELREYLIEMKQPNARAEDVIQKCMRTLTAYYLLARLGELQDAKLSGRITLMLVLISSIATTIGVTYGLIRTEAMEGFKLFKLGANIIDNIECEGVYQFVEYLGQQACRVCPDWNMVPRGQINSVQGCIDGLFALKLSPKEIIKHLKNITLKAKITHLDWSKLDWQYWSAEELHDVLEQLKAIIPEEGLSNWVLASETSTLASSDPQLLSVVAHYLPVFRPKKLILSNITYSNKQFVNFANTINFQMPWLTDFKVIQSNLSPEDAYSLQKLVGRCDNLRNVCFDNNPRLGDNGFNVLVNTTLHTAQNLTSWSSQNIGVTNDGLVLASASFENKTLEFVDIGRNGPFDQRGLVPFFNALSSNPISTLGLQYIELNDLSAALSQQALSGIQTLRYLMIDGNLQLSGEGLSRLLVSVVDELEFLGLSALDLGNKALSGFTSVLGRFNLVGVDISDNNLGSVGDELPNLFQAFGNMTRLNTMVASNNGFGTEVVSIFLNETHASQKQWQLCDVSNNPLDDTAGEVVASWVLQCRQWNVGNTQLGARFLHGVGLGINNSPTEFFDVSSIANSQGHFTEVFEALPGSKVSHAVLAGNALSQTERSAFLSAMAPHQPQPWELRKKQPSLNARRFLHESQKHRDYPVKSIDARQAGFTTDDYLQFCHQAPGAHIDMSATDFSGNEIDERDVNLGNCQISASSSLEPFNFMPDLPLPQLPFRCNENDCQSSTTFSMGQSLALGLVANPAILIVGMVALALLIYKLYQWTQSAIERYQSPETSSIIGPGIFQGTSNRGGKENSSQAHVPIKVNRIER